MEVSSFMYRIHHLIGARRILLVMLMSLLGAGTLAKAQDEKDPHRPACTNAYCRKIKSLVKARYCGASPYGNGPDDGCEIKRPEKPGTRVDVLADYDCE